MTSSISTSDRDATTYSLWNSKVWSIVISAVETLTDASEAILLILSLRRCENEKISLSFIFSIMLMPTDQTNSTLTPIDAVVPVEMFRRDGSLQNGEICRSFSINFSMSELSRPIRCWYWRSHEIWIANFSTITVWNCDGSTQTKCPNKPQLAKALQEHALNMTSMIPESSSDKNENNQVILDGGSFIHKIKWQTGATYNEIAKAYASFVLKRYGTKYVYGNVLRVLYILQVGVGAKAMVCMFQ